MVLIGRKTTLPTVQQSGHSLPRRRARDLYSGDEGAGKSMIMAGRVMKDWVTAFPLHFISLSLVLGQLFRNLPDRKKSMAMQDAMTEVSRREFVDVRDMFAVKVSRRFLEGCSKFAQSL